MKASRHIALAAHPLYVVRSGARQRRVEERLPKTADVNHQAVLAGDCHGTNISTQSPCRLLVKGGKLKLLFLKSNAGKIVGYRHVDNTDNTLAPVPQSGTVVCIFIAHRTLHLINLGADQQLTFLEGLMRWLSRFTRQTRMTWKMTYLFLLFLVFPSGNQFLRAQAIGGGQIQGTVTDETGSAVSGATVEAVQTESGLHRIVTSGADGGYNLPSLPVGPYTLKVTAAGFSTYDQSGIVIQVGNELRVDVKLQVGGVSQTVQVSAAASMVQTEDQSISQVVDRQRTVDLPLNGRQATQLILLTPGTAIAPATDLASSKNYPSAVTYSVAGAQATNINYLMDAADNNDAFTNVNLPFPFPDAIQEFSVQTSGLSPQYGIHPGAVVNVVTRAGGNSFHGTLFEFFRNGDMNARNHFSTKQDTLKRNQFGGVLGGPIRKDKLFFFGGYQGTRTRQQTNAVTSYVPTTAMLNGDFSAYASAACQSGGVAKQLINPATGTALSQ